MHPFSLTDNETTYFAYATLLELAEMHKYCPCAQSLGVYRLKDYRLSFAACGPDPSIGGCTLVPDTGNIMHGILYKLSLKEMSDMDAASGIDKGLWSKKPISLLSPEGETVAAETYIIPTPSGPFSPSAAYMRPIIDGAKSIPLPDSYVAQLEKIVRESTQKKS